MPKRQVHCSLVPMIIFSFSLLLPFHVIQVIGLCWCNHFVNEHPLWWSHCTLARRIEAGWINFLFQVHYFILFPPSLTYPPSLLRSLSYPPSFSPTRPPSPSLLPSSLLPSLAISLSPTLPHRHCLSSSFYFPSLLLLLPCPLFFTHLLVASFFSFSVIPLHACVVNCVEWSLFRHSIYLVWAVGTHKWTDG